MVKVDLNACYACAIKAVENASKIVLEGFYGTKNVNTKTASYDLVTEYDKRTEEYLVSTISGEFPDHKFIGEETAANVQLTSVPTWVIDPIDGTTNFVHGDPNCVIAVGLAVDREVVLGIVCCPALKQTFTAVKGQGAFLNGTPIHTASTQELNESVIGLEVSIAAKPSLTDVVMKQVKSCVTQVQAIRSIGCAQISLCQVAMGRWDGYHVEGLGPWDVAAGSVIITEAGGAVFNVDGGKFKFEKGCILAASTKELADKLVKVFQTD